MTQQFNFPDVRYPNSYQRSIAMKYQNFKPASTEHYFRYFGLHFIHLMSNRFPSWKAFELGIIDKDGKQIKIPSTRKEKNSWTYFHQLVAKLKMMMDRQIDDARVALMIDRLFLVRESMDKTPAQRTYDFLSELFEKREDLRPLIMEMTFSGAFATDGGGFSALASEYNEPIEKDRKKKRRKYIDFKQYVTGDY